MIIDAMNPTLIKLIQSPAASFIFLVTVVTSIAAFQNQFIKEKLILRPYAFVHRKQYFTVITSGLIHGDFNHLIMNMLSFWFFAFDLEHTMVYLQAVSIADDYTPTAQTMAEIIGHSKFFLLYFGTMILADLTTILRFKEIPGYASLGASGAISGIIISMVILAPAMGYNILIFGFIPGWVYALLFMGSSFVMGRMSNDNINHEAHLWGAVGGLLLTPVMFPKESWKMVELLQDTFYGWMH